MPIVVKMRVPTKEETIEALKKAMKQFEGMITVEIEEVPEKPPMPETGTLPQPYTGTPPQPEIGTVKPEKPK